MRLQKRYEHERCHIDRPDTLVIKTKEMKESWVPVTYSYNPSYSGGRDQEDRSSKPAQATSSPDPILKKPITKKGGRVALSSNPSTAKTKERNERE
jgi:hypothetical protein